MRGEALIQFFRGTGPDGQGRLHADILKFSDEELEETHDYIQWLFPLREPSMAVPRSPYVEDEAVVQMLREDETVQKNIALALARMKQFYTDSDHWLQQGDHNHLRITRILKSVSLLGSQEQAHDFYNFIMQRVKEVQPVSEESLNYWRRSIV